MLDIKHLEFCSEIYEVEKTVEVVVHIREEGHFIRIEALHNLHTNRYKTRSYMAAKVNLQAQSEAHGLGIYRPDVWIDYDLPWTDDETADGAIHQALGFLRERCDK